EAHALVVGEVPRHFPLFHLVARIDHQPAGVEFLKRHRRKRPPERTGAAGEQNAAVGKPVHCRCSTICQGSFSDRKPLRRLPRRVLVSSSLNSPTTPGTSTSGPAGSKPEAKLRKI